MGSEYSEQDWQAELKAEDMLAAFNAETRYGWSPKKFAQHLKAFFDSDVVRLTLLPILHLIHLIFKLSTPIFPF